MQFRYILQKKLKLQGDLEATQLMNPGSGDQEDADATQPVDNAHVEVRTINLLVSVPWLLDKIFLRVSHL